MRLATGCRAAVLGILLSLPTLTGCASTDEASATLPDAVYAAQIPVYPRAKYENMMGGTSSAGIGGPALTQSLSWFFNLSDSAEQVAAFYDERLPNAAKETEEGETTYTVTPAGAEDGEYVAVRVKAGRLQITEVVKAGKRKS
jgi:hypothetical protein